MDLISSKAIPVIIVNYNQADWTVRCLRSLHRIADPPILPIVVDSASTDDSVSRIRAEYPRVEVVRCPTNRGFGAANNVGISRALRDDPRFVWLLNSDTEVDPQCLSFLAARAAANAHVGVVGAMIYEMHERERIQVSGGGSLIRRLGLTRNHREVQDRLDFIIGVSMFFRTEALVDTGGFDERFFLYYEEVDLCSRVISCGWQLDVEPAARVWHVGGASTSAKGAHRPVSMDRVFAASTSGFIRKHGGRFWPLWLGLRVMVMLVRRFTPRRARAIPSMLLGVAEGIRTFPGRR